MTSIPQSCLANDAKHSSELAASITLKQHERNLLTVMHSLLDQASSEQQMSTWAMLCNNTVLETILTKQDFKDSNGSRAADQLSHTTLGGPGAQHAYHVVLSSGIVLGYIVGLALALGCLLIPPLLICLLLVRQMITLLLVIALPALPTVHLCRWLHWWSQWLQALFWELVGVRGLRGPGLGG